MYILLYMCLFACMTIDFILIQLTIDLERDVN